MKFRTLTVLIHFTILSLLAAEPDFEQPRQLKGRVLARGTTNLLYHFERTATREGDTVRVLRVFTYPDGKLAARERATFVKGQLTEFQLEELQTSASGATRVGAVGGKKMKLDFEYTNGTGKRKSDTETTDGDVLVGDMIPYFLLTHWDTLMHGEPAKFRFIAQDRLETVGFKLVKDGELNWSGKSCVRLRMEPTSVIIAQLVDPLFFIVEKDGAHRVLKYDGRTTPKTKRGDAWKDLDAVTVYEWN